MSAGHHCSPVKTVALAKSPFKTCFNLKELKLVAEDYNRSVTDPSKRIRIQGKTKEQLHLEIRKRLESYCDKEQCWIEQDFLSGSKKRILDSAFRPKTPKEWYKNRRTWLNTYDILYVMKQYEHLYKDFMFLGVFPIDFSSHYSSGACIGDSACTLDISNVLRSGKTRFAMVLNLDKHTQSGSHWVAVYCGLDPKKVNFGIYYYDSVAQGPPKEVQEFIKKIQGQVNNHFAKDTASKFNVQHNKTQKQFKNTECGMFSIVFLTQMLKHIPFDTICSKMRKDDGINSLRDMIYRP